MKEGFKEQLAKVAQSAGLKTNSPQSNINSHPQITDSINKTNSDQKVAPQKLILEENEKLKAENLKLKQQLIEINSNLIAAKNQIKNSEQQETKLQAEILKLQQEISEQPDKNTINRWREDALNAKKAEKRIWKGSYDWN